MAVCVANPEQSEKREAVSPAPAAFFLAGEGDASLRVTGHESLSNVPPQRVEHLEEEPILFGLGLAREIAEGGRPESA